jgi:hypothetical protein
LGELIYTVVCIIHSFAAILYYTCTVTYCIVCISKALERIAVAIAVDDACDTVACIIRIACGYTVWIIDTNLSAYSIVCVCCRSFCVGDGFEVV